MYELKITVKKVMGECTADPPMKPGDYFTVSNGDIQIPEGGYICLWALQSLIPLLPQKERKISETRDKDWVWRVHHAQCPDPEGRVIFQIERTGEVERKTRNTKKTQAVTKGGEKSDVILSEGGLKNLRIEVESIGGRCTSRMNVGDEFILKSGRLYIPPNHHICLYALQATLPLLPAKQRVLQECDWMKKDLHVICPDPAGNVILRIDRME